MSIVYYVITTGKNPPPPPPPAVGCISEKALILTSDNTLVPIEKLKIGDKIIGMYNDVVEIEEIHSSTPDSNDLYEITTEDNHSLIFTSNHCIWIKDGDIEDWHVLDIEAWKKACLEEKKLGMIGLDDIIPNLITDKEYEFCLSFGRIKGKVLKYEKSDVKKVYGLTIKDSKSPGFYANGFLVEANHWEFSDYRNKKWNPINNL